jgi:hypothetical protein
MHDELYEGFHYVVEDKEPVEREFLPLEERLQNQNLWQSFDWCFYYKGIDDGSLGIKRSSNPFYIFGYNKAQEKYQ